MLTYLQQQNWKGNRNTLFLFNVHLQQKKIMGVIALSCTSAKYYIGYIFNSFTTSKCLGFVTLSPNDKCVGCPQSMKKDPEKISFPPNNKTIIWFRFAQH